MGNIFLLYIPPTNYEATVHYEDTIKQKVPSDRIFKYVDSGTKYKLQSIFGPNKIAVWGSRDTPANRAKYEKMQDGDDILIVEGNTIKLLGKIASKTINPDLSYELWKDLKGKTPQGWSLIYFIANPQEINLPFAEFVRLFNYSSNYTLKGFTAISDDKLKEFYSCYDDLYSILVKIKLGQPITQKKEAEPLEELIAKGKEAQAKYLVPEPEEERIPIDKSISEHLEIQWKLINLGIKAGSKIWIPQNDQSKIRSRYQFTEFEENFSAGLDVPTKYVDNIDVIWKHEFRIDGAFEIENTTEIYSGLLRFSDLKIIAPNSTYPLFIVAPGARKNKVIEQLKRPTFKSFEFENKVKFLPFEIIDEIDNFFRNSASGLSIDLLDGKAEVLSIN